MIYWTSRFLLSVGMTLPWWVLGEHGGGSATAMLSPLLKTDCHSERSEESAVDKKERS
jgi:hypothetical protein